MNTLRMKKILLAFLVLVVSFGFISKDEEENKTLKLANALYENGEYYQALKYYKKALRQVKFPTDSYENMASAYLKMGDVKNAHKYFLTAEKRKNAHREIEVVHAFALKRVGQYRKAKALLKHYMKMTNDSSVVQYIEDCDLAMKWTKPNPKVKVAKVEGINSFYSDMSPYFYNGKIIFSSSREEVLILDKSGSTGEPYYRLYSADIDGLKVSEIEHYHNHEKRNHNISSFCFGNTEDEVFYSTNEQIKKEDTHNISPLKIFMNTRKGDEWGIPELIISGDDHKANYSHPFYNKETSTLFFTSNREGGYGGMDIYYTQRNGDGSWSAPINAGEGVNSMGDEAFPSFYGNTLYFSSDTKAGLGGYDIFSSSVLNNTFLPAENMKMPINTNYDDFGFTFTDTTYTLGYFSSNRKGTKGSDDIFAFRVAPQNTRIIHLSGIAIDAVTGEHIPNAAVQLEDEDGGDLGSLETDEDGHYELELIADKEYAILGSIDGYFNIKDQLSTKEEGKDEYEKDLVFEKQGDINIKGKVVDDQTKEAVGNVQITMLIKDNDPLKEKTASSGKFDKKLEHQRIARKLEFQVKFEKEGYISQTLAFNEKANEKGFIEVEAEMHKLDIGLDIGKVVDVQPIYFDLDKAEIRDEAASELDKVVQAMKDNPNVQIELGSHTDARGDDVYNLDLSERRAKASMNYIISKGIAKGRLTSKGYGETKLVNDCGNDMECDEEQHQENRRTEFKITKF